MNHGTMREVVFPNVLVLERTILSKGGPSAISNFYYTEHNNKKNIRYFRENFESVRFIRKVLVGEILEE